MLLFALAVLILAGGFVAKRWRLPPPVRRRLMLVGAVTATMVLILAGLRLTPLAVLAMLMGAGAAAQTVARAREGFTTFEGTTDEPPRRQPPARGMSRDEALLVLGLAERPSAEEIQAAHKRMILRAHPDQGGSNYLAAKVNEAKTVLLPKDSTS